MYQTKKSILSQKISEILGKMRSSKFLTEGGIILIAVFAGMNSSVFTSCAFLKSAEFLKDFKKLAGYSSMFSIFPCNIEDSLALIKALKKENYFVRIASKENSDKYPIPSNKYIFIADLDCTPQIVNWSSNINFFRTPLRWLFLHNPSSNITGLFANASILVDSDVTLAQTNENGTISLKKIFRFRVSSDIIEEQMAEWSRDESFVFNPNFVKNRHRRRKDFKRTVLTSSIVITQNESLKHLTDKREKHIDSIAKVNYVLVKHLYDFVNASFHYTVESTWGYKNNKSEWSGMIGELTKNKADIGGTALFITADRVAIIDYIAMTTKTRSKFVFREPKLSYVTNVFVLPFDKYVWISTVTLVIVTGLTLLVIVKWEKRRKEYEIGSQVHLELEDSFADIAVLTFGAFCQQGASAIPFSLPGRITTIFLFISLMFLYTSYSANIVALLQSSSKSIQTLEDLLKSRLEVGVDDTVFNHFYFPNATEPIRKALYQKKVAPPGQPPRFYPILEGVKIMRKGLFAFHMETGPGYKIVGELFEEGEKCSLQEIQFLQVPDPWLAIQKNSSFKESLKIGLFLIRESGLQNREIDAIYTKKPVCTNRGNTFISVGIVDCYPPAVVLAGGIIISFCLFVAEQCAHLRSKEMKRKKRKRMRKF